MTAELTVWVTPFTNITSLDDAIASVAGLADSHGAHGNLLLPVAYGGLPQSMCRQSLPHDMLVASPMDVSAIRSSIEAAGLGFGSWAVPIAPDDAPYHAAFAAVSGYMALNFEGTPDFWQAGDNAGALDAYWGSFWNALGLDADVLNGNVAATMVPTPGEQLNWSTAGLQALSGGCNVLLLEVYGGPNTQTTYEWPNDWPQYSMQAVASLLPGVALAPIIALANLAAQWLEADALGNGNVHVWAI